MPDFLSRLAARTLGLAPVAQPVVPVMYTTEGAQPERRPSVGLEEVNKSAVASYPPQAMESHPRRRDSASRSAVIPETRLVPAQRATLTHAKHDASDPLSPRPRHQESEFLEAPRARLQPEREFAPSTPVPPEISTLPLPESHVWAASPSSGRDEHERIVAALATTRREMAAETNSPASGPSSLAMEPVSVARRAPEAPVIRVNIGRVEVRAEFPPPVTRPAARRSQSSALSLEEYARQRKEGLR